MEIYKPREFYFQKLDFPLLFHNPPYTQYIRCLSSFFFIGATHPVLTLILAITAIEVGGECRACHMLCVFTQCFTNHGSLSLTRGGNSSKQAPKLL